MSKADITIYVSVQISFGESISIVEKYLEFDALVRGLQELYRALHDGDIVEDDAQDYIKQEEKKAKEQNIQILQEFIEKTRKMNQEGSFDIDELKSILPVASESMKDIIEQHYIKPSSLIMSTTKVTNLLFNGKVDLSEPLDVSVGGKGKLVNTKVFVSVPSEDNMKMSKNLTPYDREVLNGICSILKSGQTVFTQRQVYEAFAGKSTTSPQSLAAVTRSINKLRTTLISIDWTEHAKMKGLSLEKGDYVQFDENMLNVQSVTISSGGQATTGYRLLTIPILYRYSEAVGQLCTVDKKFLDVNISNTEESIVLKNWLIRRIDSARKKRSVQGNTILLSTMFEECQITGNKVQMQRK